MKMTLLQHVHTRKYWFLTLFVVTYLGFYFSPLIQETTLVGGRGDTLAHAWWIQWFCDNYWQFNFITNDVYPPHGVNMAGGYDSPAIFSLTCLTGNTTGMQKLNGLAFLQMLLIFISSLLVAKKYITRFSLQVAFVFFYSMSPFVLERLEHHINLLSLVWGFALVFYLFEDIDLLKTKRVMLSFALLGLIFTSAWQTIPNLTPLLVLLMLRGLYRRKKQFVGALARTILGMGIMLLVMLPFSLPMMLTHLSQGSQAGKAGLLYFTGIESYLLPWKNYMFYHLFPQGMRQRISSETIAGFDPLIWLIGLLILIYQLIKRKLFVSPFWIFIAGIYAIIPFSYYRVIGIYTLKIGGLNILYDIFPLSLTRVPSRLAIGFVFMLLLIALVWLDRIMADTARRLYRYIGIGLALYSMVAVTIMSGNIRVRHEHIDTLLPSESIQQIRNSVTEGSTLTIPLGVQGSDQMQNLVQLLTSKPIVSGYMSYAVQDQLANSLAKADPILSKFNCNVGFSLDPHNINTRLKNDFIPILAETMDRYQIRWVMAHYYKMGINECTDMSTFFSKLGESGYFNTLGRNEQIEFFQLLDKDVYEPALFVSYNPEQMVSEGSGLKMLGSEASLYFLVTQSGKIDLSLDALPHKGTTPRLVIGAATTKEYDVARAQELTVPLYIERGIQTVVFKRPDCQQTDDLNACLDQLYFDNVAVDFE